MCDKIKGKPPLDLYQAVREIACRLDEVIDYLNNNDPAFGNMYVRTFNGNTGDVVGVSSVNGQTGDVTIQGGGAVDSVNGKTGDVTLTGDDISLSTSDGQSISSVIGTLYGPDNAPPYPVTSVNSKTGAVEIKGSDIPVDNDNNETVAAELAKKYDASNPPPYPVTSVNGQTGDVEISAGGGAVDSVNGKTGAVLLTASDINATAGGTVQQNIDTFSSDINELVNEVDGKYSASNPPPYPVTSVNDSTGNVKVRLFPGVNSSVMLRDESAYPGLDFSTQGAYKGALRFNTNSPFEGGYYTLEVVNEQQNATAEVYTRYNQPKFKNMINSNAIWLISPGWGSYVPGLLKYLVTVTPDESGWITIPWPSTITHVVDVVSYVAYSVFPATLYNVTINQGSNIRAALSYGSSPWPNQNPFQINLLMIAS